MRRWAIEFRSGSFFVDHASDRGGSVHQAKRFRSKRAADRFLRRHQWMLWNGGMPLKVAP